MKYFYFFIFFNVSFIICAQTPLDTLINNNWRLIEYDDGSKLGFYDFLNNPELNHISLNFFIDDETLYYQTQACQTKTGTVGEIIEDGSVYKFSFGTFEIEGDECDATESQIFESAYFSHIYDEFDYWFYFIENEDGSLHLNLSSSIFCTAVFTNKSLSNQEVSQNSISTFPNPVQNKLTLENPNLKITKVKITDVKGNLILQQKINSLKTELDFSHFSQGIYFLTAESNGKFLKTKKIIKK